jgi:excisionase family DNA binding protein
MGDSGVTLQLTYEEGHRVRRALLRAIVEEIRSGRPRPADLSSVLARLEDAAREHAREVVAFPAVAVAVPAAFAAGEWMTASEAATLVGVTVQAIRLAARTGRIVGRRVGRAWLLHPDSVEAYRLRKAEREDREGAAAVTG